MWIVSTYLINKSCSKQRVLTCILVGLAWLSPHIVKYLFLDTTQTPLANKRAIINKLFWIPLAVTEPLQRTFALMQILYSLSKSYQRSKWYVAYTRLMILQRWFKMENPYHFIDRKRSYPEFWVWPICQYLRFSTFQ